MTALLLLAAGIVLGTVFGLAVLVVGSAAVLLFVRDAAMGVLGRDVLKEIGL